MAGSLTGAPHRRLIMLAFGARAFSVAVALVAAFAVAPSAYGVYGQVQAVGLVFSVVALLRYERVVVATPSIVEALGATRIGLAALVLLTPTGAALGYAAMPDLTTAARPALAFGLLAAVLTGRGLVLLAHSWLLRARLQSEVSKLIALQAGVQFAAQIALLGAGIEPVGALLAGDAIGSAAAVLSAHARDPRVLRLGLAAGSPRSVLSKWRALPTINLPAALMSQGLVSLPLLAWSRLAGAEATGHLALAMRIADAPMQLIAATATSLALTTRLWSSDAGRIDGGRKAAAYIGVVAAAFAALLAAAWIGVQMDADGRVARTAAYLPVAGALAAAVAFGAPHADLVAFAGRERVAFMIHGAALLAGLLTAAIFTDAPAMLMAFVAIMLARSGALWLALPRRSRAT